jgi:hypothetical protein
MRNSSSHTGRDFRARETRVPRRVRFWRLGLTDDRTPIMRYYSGEELCCLRLFHPRRNVEKPKRARQTYGPMRLSKA